MAEGARVDESGESDESDDRRDRRVTWRVFFGVALIIGVLTALYLPSEEAAGIVMLVGSVLLALVCGAFLWRWSGRAHDPDHAAVDGPAYLPESSPWPFGIGLGATLVLIGLVVGIWLLIPGVALLGVSIGGFARQSRHRFNR